MYFGNNQMQQAISNDRERNKIKKEIKYSLKNARECMKRADCRDAYWWLKQAKLEMIRLQQVGLNYHDKEYEILNEELRKTMNQLDAIDKYGKNLDDYEVVKNTMEHYKKWDW